MQQISSKRFRGQLLVALGTLLVASGCAPATPAAPSATPAALAVQQAAPAPNPPQAGQRATVRVGGIGGSNDRALWVGLEKGFYDEQGIDLDIQTLKAPSDMIPLLSTNQLDAAQSGSLPGFFNAVANGTDLKIVSNISILHPTGPGIKNSLWAVVRKDLAEQVKSVADLRGRKIAITAVGSTAQFQLEKVLQYHGLSLSDVQIETIPFADQPAALANKAVDAALALEPLVTQLQSRNIAVPIFEVAAAMPNHPAQWLFYSGDFIKSQPDVARRFMLGYVKSLRYMEDAWRKGLNREDVVQMFIKYTPVKEPQLYAQMGVSYSETNGSVNVKAVGEDQDFFFRQGLIKQPIDVNSIVDTSFGEYAVQVLGRYSD